MLGREYQLKSVAVELEINKEIDEKIKIKHENRFQSVVKELKHDVKIDEKN